MPENGGVGAQAVSGAQTQSKEEEWYQHVMKIIAQDRADSAAEKKQDTHDIKYENRLRGDVAKPVPEGSAKPLPPNPPPAFRPMQIDPAQQTALQQEQLKKAATLFHAGQMDQINYGNMTPASQQLFLDYMQLWGPGAGSTRGVNPNAGPVPISSSVYMQQRPGKNGTRPPY